MVIRDLRRVIELPMDPRFVIIPKTKPILGVYPEAGRFVSLSLNDPRLDEIAMEEIETLRIEDNRVYLEI